MLTVAALVVYAAMFRADLDYRFEVAAIGITWLVLTAAGPLLAIAFWRAAARWPRRGGSCILGAD